MPFISEESEDDGAEGSLVWKWEQRYASFTVNPWFNILGAATAFTDTTATIVPAKWLWDFGDGGTSNVQNPSHTYTSAGMFTVNLMVNDRYISTRNVYVAAICPAPLPVKPNRLIVTAYKGFDDDIEVRINGIKHVSLRRNIVAYTPYAAANVVYDIPICALSGDTVEIFCWDGWLGGWRISSFVASIGYNDGSFVDLVGVNPVWGGCPAGFVGAYTGSFGYYDALSGTPFEQGGTSTFPPAKASPLYNPNYVDPMNPPLGYLVPPAGYPLDSYTKTPATFDYYPALPNNSFVIP